MNEEKLYSRKAIEEGNDHRFEYPVGSPFDSGERPSSRYEMLPDRELFRSILEPSIFIDPSLPGSRLQKKIQKRGDLFFQIIKNVNEYIYSVIFYNGIPIASFHSPRSEKITGYTPREYRENPKLWYEMIHPGDRERVVAKLESIHHSMGDICLEHRIFHKNGDVRWIQNNCSLRRKEDGSLKRLDGFIMDITVKKEMEESLLETLHIAEEMQRKNSLFYASLTHDIKNPLQGILGMARLLEGTELSMEQKQYLDMLSESGNNLSMLLNDMLDHFRLEPGIEKAGNREFSLRRVIRNAGIPFEIEAKRKGISVDYRIEEDLPDRFSGETMSLSRILMNLIHNAVKFTDRGLIRVEVSRATHSGKTGKFPIRFCISDSGPGIPEERIQKIYEPYRKWNSSVDGTGLGTFIVKQYVEILNGSIQVWSPSRMLKISEGGPGTDFEVVLPLGPMEKSDRLEEPEPGERPEFSTRLSGADRSESMEPLHVLIADDSPVNRSLLETMIARWNHRVFAAGNGKEAVEIAGRERLDLAFLDLDMPILSGADAVRIIREELRLSFPIFAASGNGVSGEWEGFPEGQVAGFLEKPFDIDELREILLRYSEKKRTTISLWDR